MPRPQRQEVAGGVFHVFNRGCNRREIFKDDVDRWTYLANLARVREATGWHPLAYCLMDNHVHLVIETPEPNLGDGMRLLHGRYVQTFNERHGEDGPLFRGRFKSKRIKDDAQLLTVVRYVVQNPREALMHPGVSGFAWSSHDATVSAASTPWLNSGRLLEYFGASGGDPLRRYIDFVDGDAA
jgi:REP element-mobilizing transposase RayT